MKSPTVSRVARLLPGLLAVASLAPLAWPSGAAAVEPFHSWSQLTTGNGYGFAVYDVGRARVSWLTERPYYARDATRRTRNLAYDAYFGLRASGGAGWLGAVPVDGARYAEQSHVIEADQRFGPLRARTYVLSPWGLEAPAVVLALRVTNASSVPQPNAAAYALLNFHLGSGAPEPGTAAERVRWDGDAYAETGPSGLTLRYVPLGAPSFRGASPENPYPTGQLGGDLVAVDDSGERDDAVAGYQWELSDLAPGETRWVGVLVTLADAAQAGAWVAGRGPEAVVRDELAAWEAWRVPPPAGLTEAERLVWRQSESVLRMGQVREEGRGHGAILAALTPGVWWIAWVRDMSYATAALARMGHAAEAADAVGFFAGAEAGAYRDLVGVDYHVSVVRYFGDGSEESDENADGPNIEFDGFGLSTWAAHEAGSSALDANADALVALIDPETGLLRADSSIWEVHWNGQQKRFAYTSIAGARGLCDAGRPDEARALRDAILTELRLPSGGIAQSVEELRGGSGAHDAAVVEALSFGLVEPRGEVAAATLGDLDAELRVPSGHGFFRNDDGGAYDRQEWVFVDLRLAEALRRAGRDAEADRLLGWITDQALLNYGLIPELMHRDTAGYQGSVPMVGFGAGAYILALAYRAAPERYQADPACFSDTGAGSSPLLGTPGDDAMAAGAGCSAAPGAAGGAELGLLLLLVAMLLLRSRGRRSRAPRALAAALLVAVAACGDDDGMGRPDGALPDGALPDGALPDGALPDGALPDGALPDGGLPDSGGADATVPPPPPTGELPRRDCRTRFVYPLGHSGATVSVAGEWSGFAPEAHPMSDGFFSGTYEASVLVPAGSWGYKVVVDGDWRLDPAAATTRYVGGVENSRIDVGDCRRPLLRVDAWDATPDGTIALTIGYVDGSGGAGADPTGFAVTMNRGPLPDGAELAFDAASGRLSVVVRGLAMGKYTFRLSARDAAGATTERELLVPMWIEPEPFEWSDGPLYFVFTDRFRNGDPGNDRPLPDLLPQTNYHGGDLAGVLAAMREGYFDQLGVRSIWLSPVNDNTDAPGRGSDGRMYSGYHGYWPSAPRDVESRFGTLDDLRALTAEAHARGIRILVDLVQNQVHRDHPHVSAHPDWFNGDGSCTCGSAMCPWEERPLDCWFTDYLPDVNWTNMAAVDQMIDDAMFWLTEADVDGFRVDAVKHMQFVASTALRARIHETLETGNTRYYTVGETFTGSDGRDLVQRYIGEHALHAQFDFPLFWSIVGAFAQDGGTMTDLDNAVRAGESVYTSRVMSPFLGNHDVERFMSRAAGQLSGDSREQGFNDPPPVPTDELPFQRAALAFTFLLTQPGVPLVYYGDEIGTPGAGDPDNRRDMRFGADLSPRQAALLEHVRAVGRLRSTQPGLRRGARTTLLTDGDGYVYARGAARDVAIVVLNRGTTARSVRVALPAALGLPDGTVLEDRLGASSPITVAGGGIDVPFGARASAIYAVR